MVNVRDYIASREVCEKLGAVPWSEKGIKVHMLRYGESAV
jgi:hypothetical protein